VRALQASGRFRVRVLTRHPAKHPTLGDEVGLADFNRPETLRAAFAGAHGVFLVTIPGRLARTNPSRQAPRRDTNVSSTSAVKWVHSFAWRP